VLKTKLLPLSVFLFASCGEEVPSHSNIPVTELHNFETIVGLADNLLGNPLIVRINHFTTSLFTYDLQLGSVLEIGTDGELIRRIGRRGEGPVEYRMVSGIFPTEEYLSLTDPVRRMIHTFDYDGTPISSVDHSTREHLVIPPLPPMPANISINPDMGIWGSRTNQPVVTSETRILLPSNDQTTSLYELTDWKQENSIAIGPGFDESELEMNFDRYREEIADRSIPSIFRSVAFPVINSLNQGELYLIFPAFPKIMKYNEEGELLWERDIGFTEEKLQIRSNYYDMMDHVLDLVDGMTLLRHYASGVVSPKGDLYLLLYATEGLSLWMHRFNPQGELTNRYHFDSEVHLRPTFDVDFESRRIYLITEETEIRAYEF